MNKIKLLTSDNKIWNESEIYTHITKCMCLGLPFIIDLNSEGPDLKMLGIYSYLENSAAEFTYDLQNITINTANILERHEIIKINYIPPLHLLEHSKSYHTHINKVATLNHFGCFIGRSNSPRLQLASFIYKNYNNISQISFNFNLNDSFHRNNVGLDDSLQNYKLSNIVEQAKFLTECPIYLKKDVPGIRLDRESNLNHSQQLFKNDSETFLQSYSDFLVEVVCESYFTGNTFFPTEKTFRPMLLKTPFIIQGSQYFLHNLRKMGFQTFNKWWSEGYAEDPADAQVESIKSLLNDLSLKSADELYKIYLEMTDILDHNYNLVMKLTKADYLKILQ